MRQGSVLSVLPGRSLHVLLLERWQAATHASRSSLQSLHPPSSLLLFLSQSGKSNHPTTAMVQPESLLTATCFVSLQDKPD